MKFLFFACGGCVGHAFCTIVMLAIFLIIVADLYSRDFGLVFFIFAMVCNTVGSVLFFPIKTLLSVKILKKKMNLKTTGTLEGIHRQYYHLH